MPDRPEHHYRYDPPKAQMYVATTLSWLGREDPNLEPALHTELTGNLNWALNGL